MVTLYTFVSNICQYLLEICTFKLSCICCSLKKTTGQKSAYLLGYISLKVTISNFLLGDEQLIRIAKIFLVVPIMGFTVKYKMDKFKDLSHLKYSLDYFENNKQSKKVPCLDYLEIV